jgi:vacuolar-type H+-ATPase subunit I/STV1
MPPGTPARAHGFLDMQRQLLVLGLTFLGLAAFSFLAVWAFSSGPRLSSGLRALGAVWPYLAASALITGAFAGLFMWLAFYSANYGYDNRGDPEDR